LWFSRAELGVALIPTLSPMLQSRDSRIVRDTEARLVPDGSGVALRSSISFDRFRHFLGDATRVDDVRKGCDEEHAKAKSTNDLPVIQEVDDLQA
jgi:hypothetical protein